MDRLVRNWNESTGARSERKQGLDQVWRRERDSNPRYTFWAYTRFPVVLLQPARTSLRMKTSYRLLLFPQAFRFFGGEGGIRTHVPCSSQDKSISSRPRYGHFGTSPHYRDQQLPCLSRRERKKPWSNRAQACSSTPPTTCILWLKEGTLVKSTTLPAAPDFGSKAPKTSS